MNKNIIKKSSTEDIISVKALKNQGKDADLQKLNQIFTIFNPDRIESRKVKFLNFQSDNDNTGEINPDHIELNSLMPKQCEIYFLYADVRKYLN